MDERRRPTHRTRWTEITDFDDEDDPPPRRRWGRRLLLTGLGVVGFCLLAGVLAAVFIYQELARDLPKPEELGEYQPSLVTKIYASDGELIADFFVEKRFLVPLEEIPLHVRQATIAVEDSRFYTHTGIDWY